MVWRASSTFSYGSPPPPPPGLRQWSLFASPPRFWCHSLLRAAPPWGVSALPLSQLQHVPLGLQLGLRSPKGSPSWCACESTVSKMTELAVVGHSVKPLSRSHHAHSIYSLRTKSELFQLGSRMHTVHAVLEEHSESKAMKMSTGCCCWLIYFIYFS